MGSAVLPTNLGSLLGSVFLSSHTTASPGAMKFGQAKSPSAEYSRPLVETTFAPSVLFWTVPVTGAPLTSIPLHAWLRITLPPPATRATSALPLTERVSATQPEAMPFDPT